LGDDDGTSSFLNFMTDCPTIFHAVDGMLELLRSKNYEEVGCPESLADQSLTARASSCPLGTTG
jgi:aspartyl aminopeptidase